MCYTTTGSFTVSHWHARHFKEVMANKFSLSFSLSISLGFRSVFSSFSPSFAKTVLQLNGGKWELQGPSCFALHWLCTKWASKPRRRRRATKGHWNAEWGTLWHKNPNLCCYCASTEVCSSLWVRRLPVSSRWAHVVDSSEPTLTWYLCKCCKNEFDFLVKQQLFATH